MSSVPPPPPPPPLCRYSTVHANCEICRRRTQQMALHRFLGATGGEITCVRCGDMVKRWYTAYVTRPDVEDTLDERRSYYERFPRAANL